MDRRLSGRAIEDEAGETTRQTSLMEKQPALPALHAGERGALSEFTKAPRYNMERREGGFTLLEVMIALTLVAIVFVPLLG
ncbi:MAG: prepilin-type N-terminal cleavage/methylation domain-containing protein, partial [Nitrospirae bacterium]|nr:prepilin-type N-terminal cleavage/methylation domain-containing protein [Nitrospirota bacterium]